MQYENHNCHLIAGEVCRVKVLPPLFQLSKVLDNSESLSQAIDILLQIMERNLGVVRGMVNLYSRKTGRIFIHKSIGLTSEEERRGIYSLGEGITGEVVETGKAVIIPEIGNEPKFLNRTQSMSTEDTKRLSFICVPIIRGQKVMGTISAEITTASEHFLNRVLEVLTIIATMTAHAAELFLLENEEKSYWLSENQRLQDALKKKYRFDNIIGDSKPMREIHAMVERIAQTKTTVLILGESGVGKELVANAIHYASQQANGPCIKFNCAALPESLIESELFGHEKGAFTSAGSQRIGRFEEADGGTIFLDEIGEIPMEIQSKLLRVLEEKSFERVGGNKTIKVDIRLIAATNRDLGQRILAGKFREDLFYRLNVLPVHLPPLKERPRCLVPLAQKLLEKATASMKKTQIAGFTPEVLAMIQEYDWPGNIRQLANTIERAVILEDGDRISLSSLQIPELGRIMAPLIQVTEPLETHERELILKALTDHLWVQKNAARCLGISPRALNYKIKKFGITHPNWRKHKAE